jgi:hypothetical protein
MAGHVQVQRRRPAYCQGRFVAMRRKRVPGISYVLMMRSLIVSLDPLSHVPDIVCWMSKFLWSACSSEELS